MLKRLLIFNKDSKHQVGRHDFWEDTWTPIINYWETYNSTLEKPIIIDKTIPLVQASNGFVIQPVNWDSESSNAYEYIDPKDISIASLAGNIKNSSTQEIITGVTVEIKEDAIVKYSDTSDENGNYEIKKIYPKTYTIIYSKTGFDNVQKDNYVINIDSPYTENIEMTPSA